MTRLIPTTLVAITILFALSLAPTRAAMLYGVIGDGGSTPETLYSIDITDASTTLIQAFGNGGDGEEIAFNPADGLIYHWSGSLANSVMETFDPATNTITSVGGGFGEVSAVTYDPSTGNFLAATGRDLVEITPAGALTDIGSLPIHGGGMAFVGSNLYMGEANQNGDELHRIDKTTGSSLGSVYVSIPALPGFNVLAITALSTHPVTGELYGVLRDNGNDPGSRRLAIIDPTTGDATDIGALSSGMAGIAFVPEPASALLLALGGLLLVVRRRAESR